MAYTEDKKPLGLSTLNSLATNDTFIVGDTSDLDEVTKTITFSDLLTQLQAVITASVGVINPTGTVNGSNTVFTSPTLAKWIDTDTGHYFPNKGYTQSGTGPYTYTMDLAPNDYIYLIS